MKGVYPTNDRSDPALRNEMGEASQYICFSLNDFVAGDSLIVKVQGRQTKGRFLHTTKGNGIVWVDKDQRERMSSIVDVVYLSFYDKRWIS
jgi:hypothetical protein